MGTFARCGSILSALSSHNPNSSSIEQDGGLFQIIEASRQFGRDLCVISITRAQYSSNSYMSILIGTQARYIGYSRADCLAPALGRPPSLYLGLFFSIPFQH